MGCHQFPVYVSQFLSHDDGAILCQVAADGQFFIEAGECAGGQQSVDELAGDGGILPGILLDSHELKLAGTFRRREDADVSGGVVVHVEFQEARMNVLGLNTIMALGNGALLVASPNFRRPRNNRISPFMA